jgi:hypothetical protein
MAQAKQEQAIQASLSQDTLNLIRNFGQQNAMSGAGVTMPFGMAGVRSATGGVR